MLLPSLFFAGVVAILTYSTSVNNGAYQIRYGWFGRFGRIGRLLVINARTQALWEVMPLTLKSL
jgi:hypothetical protein